MCSNGRYLLSLVNSGSVVNGSTWLELSRTEIGVHLGLRVSVHGKIDGDDRLAEFKDAAI